VVEWSNVRKFHKNKAKIEARKIIKKEKIKKEDRQS
jgi:hypothetical protein